MDDIEWYTGNPNDRLAHEIESYDSTNGNLTAWVKVPFVSADVDTILYMYYGHPNISNQEQPPEVWTNGFSMVQHLSETSGTHYDSTSYDNDGEARNGTDQTGCRSFPKS